MAAPDRLPGRESTNLPGMKSAEDIESYLLRIGVPYETVHPGIWLVKIDGPPLAVSIAGPVVAFRLKVMDLPARRTARSSTGPCCR